MGNTQARPDARWARGTQLLKQSVAGLSAAFAEQRLQLAAKAALAAGLAFAIAPHMPGAASHYAYYAPLGALVAMYHNVAGSVRQGLQALAGLAVGIGLSFILVSIAEPSPLTVALFMGIGVLLGGLPGIGSGSDWIPTAALLVLLVGGRNAEDFSYGYLVQMAAGVVVGIAVNFLIFPPLHLSAAASSLADLRQALGRQLTDMAAALKEKWPPEHEDWSRRSDELSEAASSVRHLVKEADASRRANPRRKLHPRDVDQDYRDLQNLERVTFHIQDMTDVLSDVIWEDEVPYAIPLQDNEPLADAINATGELLSIHSDSGERAYKDAYEAARTAVEACMASTVGRQAAHGTVPASESVLLSLHRILRVIRPRG